MPADIRERVSEDQGILKKIQMFIPGFRGYRKREDLRDADKMLRQQLAQKLGMQRRGLEECRSLLAQGGAYKDLDSVGGLINNFKKLEGLVAHTDGGYSGFAADIQVKEDEMNRLYEYDAGMIDHIGAIASSIDSLKSSIMAADEATMHKDIMNIKARINAFEDNFTRRMNVIQGTEV
jgi:hypothetical protein